MNKQPTNRKGEQAFGLALTAYRKNNFDDAIAASKETLKQAPNHHDALRLLGTLYLQKKDNTEAIKWLTKALEIKEEPEIFNALAVAYQNNFDQVNAEKMYIKCIQLYANHVDAHTNLGLLLLSQHKYAAASSHFSIARALHTDDNKVLINLIVAAHHAGNRPEATSALSTLLRKFSNNPQELQNVGVYFFKHQLSNYALTCFEHVVKLDANRLHILGELGAGLLQQGDIDTAILALESAISHNPTDKFSLNNLGLAYGEKKDFTKAISLLTTAVSIDDNFSDGFSNLACIVGKTSDKQTAEVFARKALSINPAHIDAMINLGKALTEQDKFSEAEDILLEAHKLQPENLALLSNLGNVYNRSGRFDEAIRYYKKSLEITSRLQTNSPIVAESLFNLGIAYDAKGATNTAIDLYKKSASLDKENKDCLLNLGISELVSGDFENAWGHYFHRPRVVPHGIELSPIRPGLDLSNKNILLVPGQGLGDEMLFLRFCLFAKKQGATINYLADPKLEGILKTTKLIDSVFSQVKNVRKYDYIFASDDLPLIFEVYNKESICKPLQLIADPHRIENSLRLLAKIGPPPYIGITWRAGVNKYFGGADYKTLRKDVPIGDLLGVLNTLSCTVVNLQRKETESERAELIAGSQNPIAHCTQLNDDLMDMLAMVSILDEYVAVSNTNVHLRASVGRPSRVLVPFPPEWRWLNKGKQSPWYPDIPIYRQLSDGNWKTALEELNTDINANKFEPHAE